MDNLRLILAAQRNEITEHQVYKRLAQRASNTNKKVLEAMAADELKHYGILKGVSKREIQPNALKVWWYGLLARTFGLAFGLRCMERGEQYAEKIYTQLAGRSPRFMVLLRDEQRHEKELLNMLSDQRLEYASSVVLGINDAWVELTGALAGLTLALRNSKMIAIIAFITGLAASLSMAASEYLRSKEEGEHDKDRNPLTSAAYTGTAYVFTVLLLISPYIFLRNVFAALAAMLSIGVLIIAGYTSYIAVAKDIKFWRRFTEMVIIAMTVTLISFAVGSFVRFYFGIEA